MHCVAPQVPANAPLSFLTEVDQQQNHVIRIKKSKGGIDSRYICVPCPVNESFVQIPTKILGYCWICVLSLVNDFNVWIQKEIHGYLWLQVHLCPLSDQRSGCSHL